MANPNSVTQVGKLLGRLGENKNDPRHGTTSGYSYWGCRCDRCCAAIRESMKRSRKKNFDAMGPDDHGLRGYRRCGCRCDICKAANSAATRAYTKDRKRLRLDQVKLDLSTLA